MPSTRPLYAHVGKAFLGWRRSKKHRRRLHWRYIRWMRTRALVIKRDGLVCRYCKEKVAKSDIEVDHILPRCRGGTNALENLAVACKTCNQNKSGNLLGELHRRKLVAENLARQDPADDYQARKRREQDIKDIWGG